MQAIGDLMTRHVACAAPAASLGSTLTQHEGASRRGTDVRGRWDGVQRMTSTSRIVSGDGAQHRVGKVSCRCSSNCKRWSSQSSCSFVCPSLSTSSSSSSTSSTSSTSSSTKTIFRTTLGRCTEKSSSKCPVAILWTTGMMARRRRRSAHVSVPSGAARRAVLAPGAAAATGRRMDGVGGGQPKYGGFPSIHIPPSGAGAPAGGPEAPYLPFRPPPGLSSDPSITGTTEDHLDFLRDSRAVWHKLAPYITALGRAGYTPAMIDEATGLTGVEQNNIVVGAQVYNSLKAGGLDLDVLSEFEVSGAEVLYELRILSNSQRKSAAEYVSANRLDAKGARDLARAIKDHERKRGGEARRFFSTAPGDCLAFSYYRLSGECRSDAEREEMVEKGLQSAVTESARKALEAVLHRGSDGEEEGVRKGDGEKDSAAVMIHLELQRLSAKDVSARAIPLVGDLARIQEEDISRAPRLGAISGAGGGGRGGGRGGGGGGGEPFATFHVGSSGREERWTVVPGWPPIAKAASPVAVIVNTETVKMGHVPITPWRSMNSSKDFPVLLIIDRDVSGSVSETEYYVQGQNGENGEKRVVLIAGSKVLESGRQPCGRVVLGMKPPLPQVEDDTLDDF